MSNHVFKSNKILFFLLLLNWFHIWGSQMWPCLVKPHRVTIGYILYTHIYTEYACHSIGHKQLCHWALFFIFQGSGCEAICLSEPLDAYYSKSGNTFHVIWLDAVNMADIVPYISWLLVCNALLVYDISWYVTLNVYQ